MIPHSSIVLPLPGSPLIQRRRLLWLSCHCLNCSLSKTQRYESMSNPPLVCSMRSLSSWGLVVRRSRRHAWFNDASDCTETIKLISHILWESWFLLPTELSSDMAMVLSDLKPRVRAVIWDISCHNSPRIRSMLGGTKVGVANLEVYPAIRWPMKLVRGANLLDFILLIYPQRFMLRWFPVYYYNE